jgi:hypothetical protein
MTEMIQEIDRKARLVRHAEFLVHHGSEGFLTYKVYWRELGGQPAGWNGAYDFFCSSYFSNLPIARIRNQLGTELLTRNQPIRPSDPFPLLFQLSILSLLTGTCQTESNGLV